IWKAVLNTDQIGVDDGFFDVGGNSLLLVAVADRLREELGVDLRVAILFKYTNVRELSAHIAATRGLSDTLATHAPAVPAHSAPRAAYAPTVPEYYQDSLAIIGISCHFPGASDHRAFWRNLRQGRAAGRFLTEVELKEGGLAEALIRDPHFV